MAFIQPYLSKSSVDRVLEQEATGWNRGQTNTQGLKITEDKGAAFAMTFGSDDNIEMVVPFLMGM